MLTLKKICYIQWLSVIYRRQYITARRMPTQCRRSNSRTSIPCTSRTITESSWERIVLRTKVPGSESSTANSLHGAKVPRSDSSRERKFQGAKRPGSESSTERKGPGAKVPGSELARVLLELSLPGANWPGSEKAVNRSTCAPSPNPPNHPHISILPVASVDYIHR